MTREPVPTTEVKVHELLTLLVVLVLPVPVLALLVVGLWRDSTTCLAVSVLLALLGLLLLGVAMLLRAREAETPQPVSAPRPVDVGSVSPDSPRGSWPWA